MARTDHLYMPEDHMERLYSSRNPAVRYVHRKRLRDLASLIPQKPLSILDAGCGEGQLLSLLERTHPRCDLFGIDITDVALEHAKSRCRSAVISKGDITAMPYADHSFDVVVITEVLEHIYEYKEVLRDCLRVLKPNGLFIISFPNEVLWTVARFVLGRRPIKVPDHVHAFTPSKMNTAIGQKHKMQRNMPWRVLPFWLSLGTALVFERTEQGSLATYPASSARSASSTPETVTTSPVHRR